MPEQSIFSRIFGQPKKQTRLARPAPRKIRVVVQTPQTQNVTSQPARTAKRQKRRQKTLTDVNVSRAVNSQLSRMEAGLKQQLSAIVKKKQDYLKKQQERMIESAQRAAEAKKKEAAAELKKRKNELCSRLLKKENLMRRQLRNELTREKHRLQQAKNGEVRRRTAELLRIYHEKLLTKRNEIEKAKNRRVDALRTACQNNVAAVKKSYRAAMLKQVVARKKQLQLSLNAKERALRNQQRAGVEKNKKVATSRAILFANREKALRKEMRQQMNKCRKAAVSQLERNRIMLATERNKIAAARVALAKKRIAVHHRELKRMKSLKEKQKQFQQNYRKTLLSVREWQNNERTKLRLSFASNMKKTEEMLHAGMNNKLRSLLASERRKIAASHRTAYNKKVADYKKVVAQQRRAIANQKKDIQKSKLQILAAALQQSNFLRKKTSEEMKLKKREMTDLLKEYISKRKKTIEKQQERLRSALKNEYERKLAANKRANAALLDKKVKEKQALLHAKLMTDVAAKEKALHGKYREKEALLRRTIASKIRAAVSNKEKSVKQSLAASNEKILAALKKQLNDKTAAELEGRRASVAKEMEKKKDEELANIQQSYNDRIAQLEEMTRAELEKEKTMLEHVLRGEFKKEIMAHKKRLVAEYTKKKAELEMNMNNELASKRTAIQKECYQKMASERARMKEELNGKIKRLLGA